ncbi:2-polyprenyl-3-methyl-6-methoxy-1,4-benzoquinone monooxygenase [Aquabacterium sp. OR-4]|uniref:2-polyprenyl-3-methyl-6-methoxy-1,4-benzoquinone monooxygenase n=1 Tax=Aquabacterium sp. OR-4 TaxID=2978127 RepID=UPI0021B3D0AB|nr:2-polyprenyl-3-methyl-6-methoxy-1,4-benzoquinone monooxygenase [Aquabacterium sp. OR-4]MDT7837586.1 2-polyprenyl-3-methyl-6-methoxy-1,4-benzoquinone monooxygenase [Aquabacterium sp. OR-4]
MSLPDALVASADLALRTLSGGARAARPLPRPASPTHGADHALLAGAWRRQSGALMRVNHVGEVCAQALYAAQALVARDPAVRAQMVAAGREETDHLAWTAQRLAELGDRPSLLNPLWYAGAFSIGLVAGAAGDRVSLGFLAETERQVEAHLASHLERLPAEDAASRAIVAQMRDDEARHAHEAESSGAVPLPSPLRWLMRAAARLMTTTAHRV